MGLGVETLPKVGRVLEQKCGLKSGLEHYHLLVGFGHMTTCNNATQGREHWP